MNYLRILYAGFFATAAMTTIMLLIPLLGLPKLTFSTLFMAIAGGHEVIGWVIHFIIGIIFAFIYVRFFNNLLPVVNNVGRGAIYSIIMFVFSTTGMWLLIAWGFNWELKEDMSLSVIGNILAYLMYGSVLGAFFKREVPVSLPT